MIKNPLSSIKAAINSTVDSISTTYKTTSKNVSSSIGKAIPIYNTDKKEDTETKKINNTTNNTTNNNDNNDTKNNNNNNDINNNNNNNANIIVPVVPEKKELPLFEKNLEPFYKGCYLDDPSELTMNNLLGIVPNSLKCIELGKNKDFKYVGIQQGNKCYGSNSLPTTIEGNRSTNCNISCDDIDTGNCGGYFYNQVYETENIISDDTDGSKENKSKEILDHFNNLDHEIDIIQKNITHTNCCEPVNSFILFIWIVILVILIYLLFIYFNK